LVVLSALLLGTIAAGGFWFFQQGKMSKPQKDGVQIAATPGVQKTPRPDTQIAVKTDAQIAAKPAALPDRYYEFVVTVKPCNPEKYSPRAYSVTNTFDRLSEWRTVYDNIDWISFPWDVPAYLGKNDPDALKAIIREIKARGIKLQAGGRPMNRFNGKTDILPISARFMYDECYAHIYEAGGQIDRILVDNYFSKCLKGGKLDKCNFTVDHALNGFVEYVRITRELIPGVKIAITEASWNYKWGDSYGSSKPHQPKGDLKKILTELKARNVLDAYIMECAYSHTQPLSKAYDGFERNKVIADWCRANGLRFGLLYEDNVGGRTSNQLFTENVLKMYQRYEEVGLRANIYQVISWFPYPDEVLPENEDYTFMNCAMRLLKEIQRDRRGETK